MQHPESQDVQSPEPPYCSCPNLVLCTHILLSYTTATVAYTSIIPQTDTGNYFCPCSTQTVPKHQNAPRCGLLSSTLDQKRLSAAVFGDRSSETNRSLIEGPATQASRQGTGPGITYSGVLSKKQAVPVFISSSRSSENASWIEKLFTILSVPQTTGVR